MEGRLGQQAEVKCGYELAEKMGARTPNTTVLVANDKLPAVGPLLRTTLGFVGNTSRMMGEEFLCRYSADRLRAIKNSHPASRDFLEERGLHLPQFAVLDSDAADSFLKESDISDYAVDTENLMLVFQFPRLIDRFTDHKYNRKTEHPVSRIAWDRMCHPIRKIVWENVDLYTKSAKADFFRINAVGEHQANLYHYLWEVSPPVPRFPKRVPR